MSLRVVIVVRLGIGLVVRVGLGISIAVGTDAKLAVEFRVCGLKSKQCLEHQSPQ